MTKEHIINSRTPIDVARLLSTRYGYTLDPLNYVRGVAMSGRIRLYQLTGEDDPAPSIEQAVEPFISNDRVDFQDMDGAVRSGYIWANELSDVTGNTTYNRLLEQLAAPYMHTQSTGVPVGVDLDYRVEDIFFVGAMLGRAYAVSNDERQSEALTAFLKHVEPQPDTGLWWHCHSSPFYWGRGNAFAALGFAEALSYLPDGNSAYEELTHKHREHLKALIKYQDQSGAWRQVINRPDSYLEITTTAILGYVLMRGINGGWLSHDFESVAMQAWQAVDERIDSTAMLRDACPNTGPLPALEDYLNRTPISGHDDRAGSMSMWFAVEYAIYLDTKNN